MEIVYKRVRIRGSARVSMFAEGKAMLQYPQGEQVTAPVGKIFAFDTLDHANEWFLGEETWRAEAEDVTKPNFKYFINHSGHITRFIREFWSRKYKVIRDAIGINLRLSRDVVPRGTVLCSSIRLIEKVS